MMRKLLKVRSVRRFVRIRSAVIALLVIGVYVLLGVAIEIFGLLSLEDVSRRVGLRNEPGFGMQQTAEKRLEDAEEKIQSVRDALEQLDPQAALAELNYGALDVADKPPEELFSLIRRGDSLYEELTEVSNLNEHPELLPKLRDLEAVAAELYPHPAGWEGVLRDLEMLLGTDRQGRSIFYRTLYSVKVALQIATVTALFAVTFGSLLGLMAAYFGGWVDHLITWLFTTFSSIPAIVLLVVLAYTFMDTPLDGTLVPIYVAFGATFWIGPCRVMRGETMKLKEQEYVQAATAIGYGRIRIMLRHVLPNAAHLMLINFSLLFVAAIKSEVILTYLNLGVKGQPSWGVMISQSSTEVVNGFFWQIGAATVFMFGLVLAFNIVSDALQDVFDPKHSA